jgi:hypothetical protein
MGGTQGPIPDGIINSVDRKTDPKAVLFQLGIMGAGSLATLLAFEVLRPANKVCPSVFQTRSISIFVVIPSFEAVTDVFFLFLVARISAKGVCTSVPINNQSDEMMIFSRNIMSVVNDHPRSLQLLYLGSQLSYEVKNPNCWIKSG